MSQIFAKPEQFLQWFLIIYYILYIYMFLGVDFVYVIHVSFFVFQHISAGHVPRICA